MSPFEGFSGYAYTFRAHAYRRGVQYATLTATAVRTWLASALSRTWLASALSRTWRV